VVFPWVPVTPIIRSRVAGSPYTSAETRPSTRRTSGTTTTGTSPTSAAPSASVRTATAPAPRACGQYAAPWPRAPGRAA
jgi:hypothetical protein